jgi:hypothetical protein
VTPCDEPDERTEGQKEWADWAAHGYRKLYQPRSILWFGGIFFGVFVRRPATRLLACRKRPLALTDQCDGAPRGSSATYGSAARILSTTT